MKKIFLTCVVALSCTLFMPEYAAAAAGQPEEEGEISRPPKRQRVHDAASLEIDESAAAFEPATEPARKVGTLLTRPWPTPRFGAVMCRPLTGKVNVTQLAKPYLDEGGDGKLRYKIQDEESLSLFKSVVSWPASRSFRRAVHLHLGFQKDFYSEEIAAAVEDLTIEPHGSFEAPAWLSDMHALKVLSFYPDPDGNNNEKISFSSIFRFPLSLEELYLDNVDLSRIPPSTSSLPNLKKLNLYHNPNLRIPSDFEFPLALEVLELYYNDLTQLPPGISQLPALKVLRIEEGGFEDSLVIPSRFEFPVSLEKVVLVGTNLKRLPTALLNLPRLISLTLANNNFSRSSIAMARFPSTLRKLKLRGCRLREIPGGIQNHPELRTLTLAGNSAITTISDRFVFPPLLEELHLNGCPLSRIPAGVERLPHLHTLWLDASTPIPAWLQAKMDRGEIEVVVNWQRLSTRR